MVGLIRHYGNILFKFNAKNFSIFLFFFCSANRNRRNNFPEELASWDFGECHNQWQTRYGNCVSPQKSVNGVYLLVHYIVSWQLSPFTSLIHANFSFVKFCCRRWQLRWFHLIQCAPLSQRNWIFFRPFLTLRAFWISENYKIASLWGHHTDVKLNVADWPRIKNGEQKSESNKVMCNLPIIVDRNAIITIAIDRMDVLTIELMALCWHHISQCICCVRVMTAFHSLCYISWKLSIFVRFVCLLLLLFRLKGFCCCAVESVFFPQIFHWQIISFYVSVQLICISNEEKKWIVFAVRSQYQFIDLTQQQQQKSGAIRSARVADNQQRNASAARERDSLP